MGVMMSYKHEDNYEIFLHCYNINNVSHYHVPGELFGHKL